MGTLLLILFHIAAVGAVYISAYRTGFATCENHIRRRVEACAAPLTEMLERLNLDIDQLLDDPPGRPAGNPPRKGDQSASGADRQSKRGDRPPMD